MSQKKMTTTQQATQAQSPDLPQHARDAKHAQERGQRVMHNLSLIQKDVVIRVEGQGEGERIDALVQKRMAWLTRAQLKKIAEEKRMLKNGVSVPAGRKAKAGDIIRVVLPPPHEDVSEMDRISWQTLHEDKRLLVVNKPPHLVVHPAGAYRYTTLLNALHKKYLGDKADLTDADPVPRLVHRIDKETSGVLVVAFDREAHGVLGKLFEEKTAGGGKPLSNRRGSGGGWSLEDPAATLADAAASSLPQPEVRKEYLALVEGLVEWNEKDIELPIGIPANDPIRMRRGVVEGGQYARTVVKVEERFSCMRDGQALPPFTLVRCTLHTGRQHQIRVHMQAVGHPLVGDHLYGIRDELREADIELNPPAPFRHEAIYLDESVSDIEASERIREVDAIKRREYWEIEAGREVRREGAGRLLLSRCALHCALMAFPHPDDGRTLSVAAPLTADMHLALTALRARNG